VIPPFDNSFGYLPPGIHDVAWGEFVDRFGFNAHRRWLLGGLLLALKNLQQAGCRRSLIDGSFVTAKRYPRDYDAAWDPAHVDATVLDPVLLSFDGSRLGMKAKYRGELFPATWLAAAGVRFQEFFQRDRDGNEKGIVRLTLSRLP
jgi:hypothetical protein